MLKVFIEQTQQEGKGCLKAAIITINNVGKIIDIGGLSNLSVVRNLVKDIFGNSSLWKSMLYIMKNSTRMINLWNGIGIHY